MHGRGRGLGRPVVTTGAGTRSGATVPTREVTGGARRRRRGIAVRGQPASRQVADRAWLGHGQPEPRARTPRPARWRARPRSGPRAPSWPASRPSVCWEILLEAEVRLSAQTLIATIPTRSAPRTPIQSRPRVIRTTTPESASPPTAPAVRPTTTGTKPVTGVLPRRLLGPGRALARGRPARPGAGRGRGFKVLRLAVARRAGDAATRRAVAVAGISCAPPGGRSLGPGACVPREGAPSGNEGCARPPRARRRRPGG